MARRRPWLLPLLPVALLRGRPSLKRFLARHALPDPVSLPWRTDVVAFVRAERARGRTIILATAADRLVADSVATRLGLFDQVLATELGNNLKGTEKVRAIRNALPGKEFDYIGDSKADLPVFAAARRAYLVDAPPDVRSAVSASGKLIAEFRS